MAVYRNFRDEDETNLDWQSDFNEEARERTRSRLCNARCISHVFMILAWRFNTSWKESWKREHRFARLFSSSFFQTGRIREKRTLSSVFSMPSSLPCPATRRIIQEWKFAKVGGSKLFDARIRIIKLRVIFDEAMNFSNTFPPSLRNSSRKKEEKMSRVLFLYL